MTMATPKEEGLFYWHCHLFETIELLVLEGLQMVDELRVSSTGSEELETP